MPYELVAEVLSNRPLSGITWELKLRAHPIAEESLPGQFVMLDTKPTEVEDYDPLNRRPFAVGDAEGAQITIFYDVVGRGTRKIARLTAGDSVRLLGPLGDGTFPLYGDRTAVVVAGGIGASGVSLLVRRLAERKVPTVVLYGARSREYLSLKEWFEKISRKGVEVRFYTDDGSFGKKGFPLQDLDEFVQNPEKVVVYACGPKPMLRALKEKAEKLNLETYLSLDRRMACGWGVCLGCVVKTTAGYERVCKEGPVFEARKLVDF
ncbi:MAG: dihydroorotate dehydrogenase electron transfer subunit [Aquificae bacterium]|nr:dihydroorotate dehydrogenase electron transfer subunit [Aquificota bacterium]